MAKVCTLGVNVAENLFGADVDPTGTEIRIRNQIFKVLGVMAPKGASSCGQNQDDQVLTPFTTVLKKLQGHGVPRTTSWSAPGRPTRSSSPPTR